MTPEIYKYWHEGGKIQFKYANAGTKNAQWHEMPPVKDMFALNITGTFIYRKAPIPRPHAELIKAWADGAEIEHYNLDEGRWIKNTFPFWSPSVKYRIRQED